MSVTRPLIGLSGRRKRADQIIGTPPSLQHLDGDWYFADYARGVLEAGGLPVHLPLDADPAMYTDHLDGILLSGGADIGPEHYGATPETNEFPPESDRDRFELLLLESAMAADVPVLGICRGLQLINVATGGTLHQHVPSHARFDESPSYTPHSVSIEADSTLAALYGESRAVNSLHHQTVDRVGRNLRVTATADGTVEGIEHESLPIIAVQWHPEMMTTRNQDPIFGWLVQLAEKRRGQRHRGR